jgi:hypothetical protein
MGIYAKVNGEWKSVDGESQGLEGIPGWSIISNVKGAGTKFEYTDKGVEWSVFEWHSKLINVNGAPKDGSVDITEGIVDTLVVGGGQRAGTSASGGSVNLGEMVLDGGTYDFVIAEGMQVIGSGDSTWIERNGEVIIVSPGGAGSYNRGAGALAPGQIPTPVISSITGEPKEYGAGYSVAPAGMGHRGSGYTADNTASGGNVTFRIPKSFDNSNLPGSEAGVDFNISTSRQALRETAVEKVKTNRKRK